MIPGERRKPARLCCREGTLQPCDLDGLVVFPGEAGLSLVGVWRCKKIIQPGWGARSLEATCLAGTAAGCGPISCGWSCSDWASISPDSSASGKLRKVASQKTSDNRQPSWATSVELQWRFPQNWQRARRCLGSAHDAPYPSGDLSACPMALSRFNLPNTSDARSRGRAPGRGRSMLSLLPLLPVLARPPFRNASPPGLPRRASARPPPRPTRSRSGFWGPTTSSTRTQTRPFLRSASARPS